MLWSAHLPENWKRFTAKVSCDTDALQYENDDVMRPVYGDDYAIACCVSAMRVGKDMQFFGARANLAKLVLLAINGGRDELKGDQVGPKMPVWPEEYLDYDKLMERIDFYRPWLAKTYVNAMNIIHYMHDKYCLREEPDGPSRQHRAAADGLRHRGHELHGRLPLRGEVRQGQVHPGPGDGPCHRL